MLHKGLRAAAGAGGGAGIGLNYVGFSTSSSPSFTAPSAGVMIISCAARSIANREVSSITIGGTSSLIFTTTGFVACSGIAAKSVSSGPIAAVITYSGSVSYEGCHCWLITGISATAHDSGGGTGGSTNDVTMTIPEGGVAIYHGMIRTSTTIEWSSATEQSQDTGNTSSAHATAYKETGTLLTDHTETVTFGSSVNSASCGASFSAS